MSVIGVAGGATASCYRECFMRASVAVFLVLLGAGCCQPPYLGVANPRIALPHVPSEHAPLPADPGYQTPRQYLAAPTRPVLGSPIERFPVELEEPPELEAAPPVATPDAEGLAI